ncbi:MAG: fibronectin type III domain-containing protein, partial [Candidatus Acetothermia bacterium]
LDDNTNYTYRVAAYNEAGESSASEDIDVTTPVDVPARPGNFTSEVLSPTEVELTWEDNSEDEEGFRIYRDGEEIAELDPDTTSYTDTGLSGSKSYSYEVAAFNEAGESSATSGVSVDTPAEIPSAPGRLETSAVSPTEIELTWEDNSENEEGFRIYRNGNKVETVGANTTSYVHDDLRAETRYCYRIVAYNETGESDSSNRNCAMTPLAKPDSPENLKASPLSPTRIRLTWNDRSNNEEGFNLYRNGSKITTMSADKTNYVDTDLNANRSYSYRVSAFNSSGESEAAGSDDVTTPAEESEEPKQEEPEEPIVNRGSLLAGIGIVVMVMGYIYSELG